MTRQVRWLRVDGDATVTVYETLDGYDALCEEVGGAVVSAPDPGGYGMTVFVRRDATAAHLVPNPVVSVLLRPMVPRGQHLPGPAAIFGLMDEDGAASSIDPDIEDVVTRLAERWRSGHFLSLESFEDTASAACSGRHYADSCPKRAFRDYLIDGSWAPYCRSHVTASMTVWRPYGGA